MLNNMGTIAVRDVDNDVFREFKAEAVGRGMTLGQAMTLAMESFLSRKKRVKFTSLKPIDWGKGTEKVSQSVDEIIYEK